MLIGGPGRDTLIGGAGNDTYIFGRDSDVDVIKNYDPTPDRMDLLKFEDDIRLDELLFSRSGNNLIISLLGTDDQVIVESWGRGEDYQLDEIHTADATLNAQQVDSLVDLMGTFELTGNGFSQEQMDMINGIVSVY